MGLGKFLKKATRSVGKLAKTVTRPIGRAATGLATGVVDAGKFAGKAGLFLGRGAIQGAGAAAAGIGKGVSGATSALGKVGIGKFTLGSATKAITHAGIGPVSLAGASKALGQGIKAVSKVPILGPIVGVGTPIHLIGAANNFANGQRLDRAALGALKNRMKDYKAVGPYAASVASLVPGIGTGVAAGISAGVALADGKPIGKIALEAAKGAIPGGAAAQAAFDVGAAIASGKKIDQVAIAALPVNDKAKQAIEAGLKFAKDVAGGKRIDQAVLARTNDILNAAGVKGSAATAIGNAAQLSRDLAAGKNVKGALLARVNDAVNLAGPEAAKALQIGTAMGTAKRLQSVVMKQIAEPKALAALAQMGTQALRSNTVLSQGLKLGNAEYRKGFAIGSGIMSGKRVNETYLVGVRRALNADGKKGFDAALAYFIGKKDVSRKPMNRRNPPINTRRPQKRANPEQSFAYFATQGVVGAGAQQKTVLVKSLAETSDAMRDGALDGIHAVVRDRKLSPRNNTFWGNLKAWVTAKETKQR